MFVILSFGIILGYGFMLFICFVKASIGQHTLKWNGFFDEFWAKTQKWYKKSIK